MRALARTLPCGPHIRLAFPGLGSVAAVVNASGSVVGTRGYYPFGGTRYTTYQQVYSLGEEYEGRVFIKKVIQSCSKNKNKYNNKSSNWYWAILSYSLFGISTGGIPCSRYLTSPFFPLYRTVWFGYGFKKGSRLFNY